MPLPVDILRLALMAGLLFLTFVGGGLYLRGFYLYFKAAHWLRQETQEEIRRRYRSSTLAAVLREPTLAEIKTHLLLSLMGPPLFAIGGVLFNLLQHH